MGAARLHIAKRNDEKRIVVGWALITSDAEGTPIVDYDGHVIPIEAAEEAFADLLSEGGKGALGVMHNGETVGDILFAFPISLDVREALGFGKGHEGVIIHAKIQSDEAWERVKSGELGAFSIEGEAVGVAA